MPPRIWRRVQASLIGVGAVIALASASAAHAQGSRLPPKKPSPEEKPRTDFAQDLKLKGDAAFDARDFEEAAKAYDAAYEASKDPVLLYNQGRAYQALARFPEALDRIERFSVEASPTLKSRVPKLDELVRELREKVATLVIHCNAERARVLVNEKVVGELATSTSFRVTAGSSHVEVASDGYLPFVRDFELRGASTTVLEVKLLSKAEAAADARSPPVTGPPVEPGRTTTAAAGAGLSAGAYVAGGVAVLAFGSAGFLWIRGRAELSELRDECGKTRACSPSVLDEVKQSLMAADVAAAVGVVAVGVMTYFLVDHFTSPRRRAMVPRVGAVVF